MQRPERRRERKHGGAVAGVAGGGPDAAERGVGFVLRRHPDNSLERFLEDVHAALLISTRAKIAAFVEWAWDYFGGSCGDAILDRSEELQINWNDDEEEADSAASVPRSRTDKAP